MNRYKKSMINRVLSLVMALLLAVNFVPITLYAASEPYSDVHTIKFSDAEKAVENASVSYKVTADGTGKGMQNGTADSLGYIERDISAATKTITVNSAGNGTVKLNGAEQNTLTVDKDSEISIELMPNDAERNKTYIQSLKINNVEQPVEKYETYSDSAYTMSDDAIIDVTFTTEYKVTGIPVDGGKIYLNDQDITSDLNAITVDEGSEVEIKILPSEHYQIKEITINGTEEIVSDVTGFTKNITVNSDVNVAAEFERLYTLTVTYDYTIGTVNTTPSCAGGKVEVAEGNGITVKATSNKNYRVSKVLKNNEEELLGRSDLGEKTSNDYIYEDTSVINIDGNYTYEITFALNTFDVAISETRNGVVELSSENVDYDDTVIATITPKNNNYKVSGIMIKNAANPEGISVDMENSDKYSENEDNTSTFVLENVTENTELEISFAVVETASSAIEDIVDFVVEEGTGELKSHYADMSGNAVYVYSKNTKVTVEAKEPYNKTNIKYAGEEEYDGWKPTRKVSSSCEMEAIQVKTGNKRNAVNVISDKKIIIIIDSSAPELKINPIDTNANGYYNKDFTVELNVSDKKSEAYSGIAKIEYWVTYGDSDSTIENNRSQTGVLFNVSENVAGISKYNSEDCASYSSIKIDAAANNSDYVQLKVTATDLSGNEKTEAKQFKINASVPKIKVEMSGTTKEEAKDGFYSTRQAVITITDRITTFDADAVLEGLEIVAKDYDGNTITDVVKAAMISADSETGWIHVGTGDTATHSAAVTFATDANYEWSISYTNKAGTSVAGKANNKSAIETVGDNVWKFTVDNKAPAETKSSIMLNTSVWNKLVETLTFGLWSKTPVTAEAVSLDDISPISSNDIQYYKANEYSPLKGEQLEELYKAGKFSKDKITISSDEAFVIYARMMDNAGNVLYISTNGYVVDMTQTEVTLIPDAANENGFYNSDVNVKVLVNEKAATDKKFSGIKKVDYTVECDGKVTQSGNLYTYDESKPKQTVNSSGTVTLDADTNLPETFEDTVKVDSSLNNSDSVVVKVTVEDNAGNINEPTESQKTLAINMTKPTINVTFDDTPNKTEGDHGWYDRNRVASITITDRASTFDSEAATSGIVITGKNAKNETVTLDVSEMISSWISDGNVYKADVTFSTDASYEWLISYTNKADLGIENDAVVYEGNTPNEFTVDKSNPYGSVTINDNTWDRLLSVLTFGLYSKTSINVTASADDEISPVTIEYYKTNNVTALSKEELDKQTFAAFREFSVTSDEQFIVYLKITDNAGNYIYICSDGNIVDMKSSSIILTPDKANANNVYNKDVNVAISIAEEEPYAGIKSVEYWVEADGTETQRQTLYSFDYDRMAGNDSNGSKLTITDWSSGSEVKTELNGQYPAKAQLKQNWSGNIVVNANKNNSSNVVVYVKTVDNGGNENTKSTQLDIDVTKPEISLSYDNNNDNEGNGYFNANRTATVIIKERTNHFDAGAATSGINITAVDAKGNTVKVSNMISSWSTHEGDTPDEAIHTAAISYSADANYTFAIAYTDKADNKNESVGTGSSVAPYKFTVDKEAPIGTISSRTNEGRYTRWEVLVNKLAFGIWSKSQIDISAVTDDATSPIASVQYYKTAETTAKTKRDLAGIDDWRKFDSLSIKANEQFTIYLKIADMAGNITYISTNGMIVDDTAPGEESIVPEVTVSPEQPVNGFYNRDVNVAIEVQDPLAGGTYSGLKTVSYRVLNMGAETQSGTLYSFDNNLPAQDELQKSWKGSITVDSELNNSNDVVIEVYAEDNSLNSSTASESIKIDVTKPTINVSYNNNTPDSEKYYKEARTAIIVISERNFNPEDVVIKIENTDGVIPSLSGWTTVAGDGNQDNTTHTATITYDADGDYMFDIDYTDLADNKCDGETYSTGTANETEFTIDTTVPQISVSYNNNSALNEKYFKENRTATVTVVEHNFDVSRVEFTQTASLDGSPMAAPAPTWSNNGDTHTATIVYDTDGDYTFDVTMTDMAGNEISKVNYDSETAAKEFTVDTNIEAPVISGVEDGKAYKTEVVPVIDFFDINYNDCSVTLTRTRMAEKDVDVTDEFIKNMDISTQGGNATNNTFDMIQDNDGIYTLTVHMNDKAGNESETAVTFTLNRFGSVYVYNDYLISLIEDGGAYVQAVEDDLLITEYNADRLIKGSLDINITCDGRPIGEADYMVSQAINDTVAVGDSGWFQYGYTISKDNFAEDGIYKIIVSSEDATGNTPENTNYEEQAILFRVDSTAPEIDSIIGLEDKVINATSVTVKYTVYDTIGLDSIVVYVNDKEKDKITDFTDDLTNYSGEFTLTENSSAQKVRLVVTDIAGNETDTDSDDFSSAFAFNDSVTVSTNFFVRWYSDTALYWGSIAGTVVALGGFGGGIFTFRKRRAKVKAE